MTKAEDKAKQVLDIKDFYGTVVLKEPMWTLDGKIANGWMGRVTILRDVEAAGFRVKGGETNWLARIQGPTESVNVLGCQIRGVYQHSEDRKARDTYSKVK